MEKRSTAVSIYNDTLNMGKSPITLVIYILVMNSFNVHKLYGGRIGWDWRKAMFGLGGDYRRNGVE